MTEGQNKRVRELLPKSGVLYYAAEYPISVHDLVSELVDYEFLIALTAIRNPRYKELFIKERRPDRYRIVDSGVFEDPEHPPSAAKLYEIALTLDADEVVAVDHIGEFQRTVDSVNEFLDLADEFPFKVMVVPQGKDFLEWLKCYNLFVNNPKVDVIGLTYHKHPAGLEEVGMSTFGIPNREEAARLALLHLLAGGFGCHGTLPFEPKNSIPKPFHVLGCGHLLAIDYYRTFPFVRSIDTSFPVQLGVEGRSLHLNAKKPAFKVNFSAQLVRAERALISENVLRFVLYCHGSKESDLWTTIDKLSAARLSE